MEPSPPGWYRDPRRPGGRRYWNGHAWVDVDGVVEAHQDPPPQPVTSGPQLIAQRRPEEAEPAGVEVVDEVDSESQPD